jgi:hypothetical protein
MQKFDKELIDNINDTLGDLLPLAKVLLSNADTESIFAVYLRIGALAGAVAALANHNKPAAVEGARARVEEEIVQGTFLVQSYLNRHGD